MFKSYLRFGCWNLRGLNDPLKQTAAKTFLRNNELSLVGFVEHKVKEPNLSRVMNFICPHWQYAHNFGHSPLGRILVCWDPHLVTVKVLNMSNQHIHCEVHVTLDDFTFLATLVYGG